MSIPDYGGVLAGIVGALQSDATLTGYLFAYTPPGGAPSQQQSIFTGTPPTERGFPCVTLRDLLIAPADRLMQDEPTERVAVTIEISVWAASDAARPIQSEIDSLLKTACRGGALDNSDWQFCFIDTSDAWRTIDVPQEYVGGSIQIQQRSKTFVVKAANKNA